MIMDGYLSARGALYCSKARCGGAYETCWKFTLDSKGNQNVTEIDAAADCDLLLPVGSVCDPGRK
jgi:hypothetical protein